MSASSDSGLAVSFDTMTTSVCSVSGSTVTLVNVGTCSITAAQLGDSNYSPAIDVTRSFNILDATAPVIVLNGSATMTIAQDSNYSDTGAMASDNVDGDLSAGIVTSGSVDTATVGIYTLRYNVSDAAGNAAVEVTRTVTVTDQTAPVISLIGDSNITIAQDAAYVDAGASASDNNDGDLTSSIVTVNPVDTSTVGSYSITYNVSDSAGNVAVEVTRTITVTDQTAPVVNVPAALTVAATDAAGTEKTHSDIALFLASATASDANDGVIATVNNDAPTTFSIRYNNRHF